MRLHPGVLLAVGLACWSVAVFALVGVMASAPTPAPSRLGIRGLKRGASMRPGSLWAQVEPFVRWVAGRVAPFLTPSFRRTLDRQITLAGDLLGLIPEEYVALCLIAAATGLSVGGAVSAALHKGPVWAALAGVLGAAIPWFQISGTAQERGARIQNGLPRAVDLLALSLSAGLDFPGGLRQIVEKASDPDDPMIEELGYLLQELSLGKTRQQALLELNARCPYDSVTELVSALVQAEQRGNPLAEVLQIQARSSRARRSVRAEDTAAKAGLKILVPCLFIFVSVILLIMGPLFMKLAPALGGM